VFVFVEMNVVFDIFSEIDSVAHRPPDAEYFVVVDGEEFVLVLLELDFGLGDGGVGGDQDEVLPLNGKLGVHLDFNYIKYI